MKNLIPLIDRAIHQLDSVSDDIEVRQEYIMSLMVVDRLKKAREAASKSITDMTSIVYSACYNIESGTIQVGLDYIDNLVFSSMDKCKSLLQIINSLDKR